MRLALMIEGREEPSAEAESCAMADACVDTVDTLFRSDHYLCRTSRPMLPSMPGRRSRPSPRARRPSASARLSRRSPSVLPGLLANAAATADHVSGGRIELGLGAGWLEREHRAFGFPFPRWASDSRCSQSNSRSCTDSGPRARRFPRHALLPRAGPWRAHRTDASSAAAGRRQRATRHGRARCSLRRRVQLRIPLAGRLRGGSLAGPRRMRTARSRPRRRSASRS